MKREERRAVSLSSDDSLNAIVEAAVDSVDWKAELAFQESLGRPELPEQELFDFLRLKRFGLPTPWERMRRRPRITLEEAFAARAGYLTPLETAVNQIVWQVDRKWLGPSPNFEIGPLTAEQRITGHAILRVVRRLYGLPEDAEIRLSHTRLETKEELSHVRLFMPGVSSVRELQHVVQR